jgi:hypothetical protein
MSSTDPSDTGSMRRSAREVLDEHWRSPGFTCPNATTYPWLWLWDSCFHSIVWAELGEAERAVQELGTALGGQDGEGFVPHLRYLDGFDGHQALWGDPPVRGGVPTSSITQPPIYGLTVAELVRRGIEVPSALVDAAAAGLWFLLERRRRSPAGLVELVHPWESGCDHSPRWDDLMAPGHTPGVDPYDEQRWFARKGELLTGIRRSPGGAPLSNDEFAVGSVAFSAMVAHCARALVAVTGDRSMLASADELAAAVASRWDPGRRTWVDDGPTARGSGRIRTSEALLALLVHHDPGVVDDVVAELTDPDAFGGEFGPAQVHRDEPTYRTGSYWRGPSWPQLDHLLIAALERSATPSGVDAARRIAAASSAGAWASGWAEYWDPDTAAPGGAAPQSWTTLAICWGEKA